MANFTNQDLDRWLAAARRAAELGSVVLEDYWGRLSQVREKPRAGLVSEADETSESVIREALLKDAPEARFLGEETGGVSSPWRTEEPCWIVDPLDGTTNYIHGVPAYCISIGLSLGSQILVGVVHVPPLKSVYQAVFGRGSQKDGKPIRVSSRAQINESLLATGFFRDDPVALKRQVLLFSDLVFKARGIRRIGAAALDLCLVAEGVFDAFWEMNLKEWDTCAGALLVREAGGVVSDYSGRSFQLGHSSILAGNPHLHQEILAEFSRVGSTAETS